MMAFFGMKLHAKNIAATYAGGIRAVVIRDSQYISLLARRKIVRMQKIKSRARLQTAKQATIPPRCYIVPSHVGKVGLLGKGGLIKSPDLCIDPSQPFQHA